MAELEPQVVMVSARFQARGSCAYTLRLAEHAPRFGIAARVVTPSAELVDPARRAALQISEYANYDAPPLGWLTRRWLLKDLSRRPPDLLHIQSRRMLPAGTWLAQRLGRPFVLTVHDYLGRNDRPQIDWNWCRKVITVSESVKRDFLSRVTPPPGRTAMIPSGIDVAIASDAPPPLDPGHIPVIGTAGPLEAIKGFPFFLGAARRVLATGRRAEFLVAGAGPEEANLRRLARELGIAERVTFAPYVLDFTQSLSAMDLFCLPSLQQGLGTIMFEAMALGKPVIASRVGGIYSIVHDNETGLLVPPSDSGDLADAILELLGDPARARAIGEASRQMVRREFPMEKMLGQTFDVYREVLAEARGEREPLIPARA